MYKFFHKINGVLAICHWEFPTCRLVVYSLSRVVELTVLLVSPQIGVGEVGELGELGANIGRIESFPLAPNP